MVENLLLILIIVVIIMAILIAVLIGMISTIFRILRSGFTAIARFLNVL